MAGAVVESESAINEGQGIPKPQLDVTARPVDTYVSPVNANRSALGQLAGSLKELNPELGKIAERFQEQAVQKGETAGAEAFTKDQGDWQKAVDNGDIPSILNPYARMKAREVFGRMAGDKMGNDIQADPQYIQENSNATTIQQHDDAFASARERWESTNLGHSSHADPLFQNQFQTMAAVRTQEARNKAVPEIERNFVTLNGLHLGDELSAHIEDLTNAGAEIPEIQSQLSLLAKDSNLPELVQRASMNQAIDAIARKRNDTTVYDLADGVTIKGYDGKNYNLGTSPDFVKLRTAGMNEIVRNKLTSTRLYNAELLQKQNGVRADVASQLITQLGQDPTTALDKSKLVAQYQAAGLGNRVKEIDDIIAAVRKGEPSDQAIAGGQVAHYTALIRDPEVRRTDLGYVTTGTLVSALKSNQISVADYSRLQEMVDKRDKKYGANGRQTADPQSVKDIFDRYLIQTRQSFSQQALVGTSAFFKGDVQKVQNASVTGIGLAFDDFRDAHPDADARDLEVFMSQYLASLRKFYLEPSPTNSNEVNVTHSDKPAPSPVIEDQP